MTKEYMSINENIKVSPSSTSPYTSTNTSTQHHNHNYSKTDNNNHNHQNDEARIKIFFIYICTSIAIRSFEAGIISSMMPSVQSSLQFDYTTEGMIAASPDYGIAPGGLLAIYTFQIFRHDERKVLIFVTFGTAFATFLCAARPSVSTLVFSRAVGGLLWSHAATLYPAWIDAHGPQHVKTLWLSGINVSLMMGILIGFVVGGMARTTLPSSITWVKLYYLEGVLMLGCGVVLVLYFDRDLIQIYKKEEEEDKHDENNSISDENEIVCNSNTDGDRVGVLDEELTPCESTAHESTNINDNVNNDDNEPTPLELLCTLLQTCQYIFAVILTGLVVGCTGFVLYFVTQICEARGLTPSQSVTIVSIVFVTSPGPGNLLGAWIVGKLGGYTDHVATFGFALITGIIAFLASLLFLFSRLLFGNVGTTSSGYVFAGACWLFFFTGGSSTPSLAGVAVSVVPNASHVASGLQFSIQNAAKIFIPQIGGFVIDRVGLLDGFDYTVIVCCVFFCILASVALLHVLHVRRMSRMKLEYVSIP